MKVAHRLLLAILDEVKVISKDGNGSPIEIMVDNSFVKTMITDFYSNKINVVPIKELENGKKFNTNIHSGFEFSEEMLHEYCRAKTQEGNTPMNFWGNLLKMIDMALDTNDGVSAIWDINLIMKCDVSILDESVPNFLPNSFEMVDEIPTFKTWRNWRGQNEFFQNGDDVYFLTITSRRLGMAEIKALKTYSTNNPSFNIIFLSKKEFIQERESWQ